VSLILHLLPESTWRSLPDGTATWAPSSLADEGFVHCSPDDGVMLRVANLIYRGQPGRFVVLSLDTDWIASEVRWEEPSPPGPATDGVLFPHVYGPLDLAAVVDVRLADRRADGTFLAFGPYDASA
jgi:uncharacterized protein (DUF952 family)